MHLVRHKKTAEKRIAQQKRECNLAVVLSFTVLMFLLTHAPRYSFSFLRSICIQPFFRIMTNIYEAITINSVLKCHDNNKGYLKIWYLYILSLINLLMVVNASLNLPIYWCVGTTFKTAFSNYFKVCKISKHCSNTDKTRIPAPPPVVHSRPAASQISTHNF